MLCNAFEDCILFSKKFEKRWKSNNLVLAGGAAMNKANGL